MRLVISNDFICIVKAMSLHRFHEAFGLIINAARADGIHIAPIVLLLGMDQRIAVYLRSARNQHPGTLGLGQAKDLVRTE